jgi:hypothetical protein
MEEHPPLRLEVLSPAGDVIAAFASPVEAWRYAALVCEPNFRPVLRRTGDGAVLDFISTSSAAMIAQWTDEVDVASPRLAAITWSVAV